MNQPTSQIERRSLPTNRWLTVFSVVMFALLVLASGYRIYSNFNASSSGEFDWDNLGYCDFQMGVYHASEAFRVGHNPFGEDYPENYPVERELPLYSPLMFVMHLPLTFFSLQTAAIIFFVFSIGMVMLLAYLSLRFSNLNFHWSHVLCLASLILTTRAGQSTIFSGYVTIELVIGLAVAIQYGTKRPWLGAIGLVIAGFKPTYAIPLVILMLCRAQFKAVAIGVSIALIGLFGGLAWIAANSSWSDVATSLGSTQDTHIQQPSEMPENSWTRIDALAIVAKWTRWNPSNKEHLLGMIPFLLVGGLAVLKVHRENPESGAASFLGGLMCVILLVSIYRHSYDASILIVPLVGLMGRSQISWAACSKFTKIVVGSVSLAVLFSYWSTQIGLGILKPGPVGWQVLTSINGFLLVFAYIVVIAEAFRRSSNSDLIHSENDCAE